MPFFLLFIIDGAFSFWNWTLSILIKYIILGCIYNSITLYIYRHNSFVICQLCTILILIGLNFLCFFFPRLNSAIFRFCGKIEWPFFLFFLILATLKCKILSNTKSTHSIGMFHLEHGLIVYTFHSFISHYINSNHII